VFAGFGGDSNNWNTTYIGTAEVINLSNPTGTCAFTPNLPAYPTAGYVNSGVFFNNQVIGCGGWNGADVAGCTAYDKTSNTWKPFTPFKLVSAQCGNSLESSFQKQSGPT
jgi:hypothetical protein